MATRTGPPRGGRDTVRRAGTRARRIAGWAIVIVLVGAGSWFLVRRPGPAPPAGSGPAPVSAALATLRPETVFRTADSLGRAGRHLASLPYYRQSLRNLHTDLWQLHFNYGTALYNATLEIEARNGLPVYALRSSWERVAFMREAIQEILAAERLARTPHDLALVRTTRARMLWLWGLPWETFAAYREAQSADRVDRALALQADRYMDLLHWPDRGVLAPPGPTGADVAPRGAGR